MMMNNEPVEENSKPAVSDKSETDVMRSRPAKIHISSELLRTSNHISELFYARKIPVLQEALKPLQWQYATHFEEVLKPFQRQYATHFEEVLKPFREQNATRVRELLKVVQGQNQPFESVAISNLSLPKIDSINFEIPVFSNQFSASLDVIGEALDNFLGSVNKTIPLEAFNLFKGLTKKSPKIL